MWIIVAVYNGDLRGYQRLFAGEKSEAAEAASRFERFYWFTCLFPTERHFADCRPRRR